LALKKEITIEYQSDLCNTARPLMLRSGGLNLLLKPPSDGKPNRLMVSAKPPQKLIDIKYSSI